MATLTSPAISEMIINIRSMLNQPDSTNSFWTDEELGTWLNEAIRLYFQQVVYHGEGQFTTITDLDITTDAETVTLPSDFFMVKGLYKKVSNGYAALPYQNAVIHGFFTNSGSSGNTYLPYYYLRGNSLVLHPIPNFSETAGLRLEYVQFPQTMITGGDTLTAQVAPIFRDLLETYVIYKAKLKESLVNGTNTYQAIKQNLDELFVTFKDAVARRTMTPSYVVPFNPEGFD